MHNESFKLQKYLLNNWHLRTYRNSSHRGRNEKSACTIVAVNFRTVYKRIGTLGRTETAANGVRQKPAFTMVAVNFRTIYKRIGTTEHTENPVNGV